jgi:hypothetical protein
MPLGVGKRKRMNQQIYANPKQLLFLYKTHPVKFFHAGRGTGKSHSIGWSIIEKVNELPRSTGMLTCKTLIQLRNKTLPVIKAVWSGFGLVEDKDYVLFKKRPVHFTAPFKEPLSTDVIFFKNGTCIEIVASTQYDSARGGSYDWIEGDEMGFFPEEFYDDVILPSNRGNEGKFMTSLNNYAARYNRNVDHLAELHKVRINQTIPHPLHHQVCLYTSPPRKVKYMWIYKFKRLALEYPNDFYWLEANAMDNIDAFGRKNLEMIRKQMNPRSFDAEMMGNRTEEAELLFYHKFDKNKHPFDPNAKPCPAIDIMKPLHASFDFSGWFNCAIIGQNEANFEYIHDALFVKTESNIDGLIDKICSKYYNHPTKFVLAYGDPRGHDRTPQGITLYQSIKKRFELHGWMVEILCPRHKKTEAHIERHRIQNEILDEKTPGMPIIRINAVTCKDLIAAILLTEVNGDFQKIKTMEKLREFPQEHAPHFTDALDYYIFQKNSWRWAKDARMQYT